MVCKNTFPHRYFLQLDWLVEVYNCMEVILVANEMITNWVWITKKNDDEKWAVSPLSSRHM